MTDSNFDEVNNAITQSLQGEHEVKVNTDTSCELCQPVPLPRLDYERLDAITREILDGKQ